MAACLFAVFLVAKIITVWGNPIVFSAWTPVALLWQDVTVVLVFALLSRLIHRRWATNIMYGALVLLTAINVPVQLALGSPITMAFLNATSGTLSASMSEEAKTHRIILGVLVVVVGISLWYWRSEERGARSEKTPVRGLVALLVIGIMCVLVGPYAARSVETWGNDRNATFTLVRSAFPRLRATTDTLTDWRTTPFAASPAEDFDSLRGTARGMNVLLVVLEGVGAQYLKPWGATEDPMPHLTSLAGQAVRFANGYSVYPESVKGLVAILSSRYPGFDLHAEQHARIASPSLATVLGDAGYTTALFHSGRFGYLGMDSVVGAMGFALAEDAGGIGGNRQSSFGIDEDATVAYLLRWVDSVPKTKPFFAAWLPVQGHHPYAHERRGAFPDSTPEGRYRNAIHEADEALGALHAGLVQRGLDKSTLVVVIADHGEAFEQHPGNTGHTLAIYEENVKVPMVLSWPGGQAVTVERPASLLDVAPTVLALLDVSPPAVFQGSSLLPASSRAALFFTDYSLGLLGLRDGCLKYIHEMEAFRSRLFDVCQDPGEKVDVARQFPERTVAYRELLRRWASAQLALIER